MEGHQMRVMRVMRYPFLPMRKKCQRQKIFIRGNRPRNSRITRITGRGPLQSHAYEGAKSLEMLVVSDNQNDVTPRMTK